MMTKENSYSEMQNLLRDFLIRNTLIESYHSFALNDKPYPFATLRSLIPGISTDAYEHPFQRSALVLVIDEPISAGLRKHIRFRSANEINYENLARLAPKVAKQDIMPDKLSLPDTQFSKYFNQLLDIDYALLLQRLLPKHPIELTHLHVKVERLTDNAVRFLARDLGYIRRSLYEKGEAYAEILERKYYEYFGFAPNASGRKCAAAMATQLLSTQVERFSVFVSCQEDCRLTLLDETKMISHYLLIKIKNIDLDKLSIANLQHYTVNKKILSDNTHIVCYCIKFRRTSVAQPLRHKGLLRSDESLRKPWLEKFESFILPLPGHTDPMVPYTWVG